MLAALLPLLAVPAAAHITMWHPSMYGFMPGDEQYSAAASPPPGTPPAEYAKWWFHGDMDKPPAEGEFLEIPAGGSFVGQFSNNKAWTEFSAKAQTPPDEKAPGLLHAGSVSEAMGCGIAIAYESDVYKIKPEDFVVISTNRKCPWYRNTEFHIPEGLPPCPPGGCHCMWGWIHNELGGGQEMYMTGYRCNVTGSTGTIPLPKPALARKCPYDRNNCTVGAKQPHYWRVQQPNNPQGYSDPPFYNEAYGFKDGAQTDLWDIDLGTTWNNNATEQAPIPDVTGAFNKFPVTERDANAPVGKATAAGAVNSPDNVTPAQSAAPIASSASASAAGSASSAPASVAGSASSAAAAEPSDINKLNVEPVESAAVTAEIASGEMVPVSVASNGSTIYSESLSPTQTIVGMGPGESAVATGVSNSTVPGAGAGNGTVPGAGAGAGNSTAPVGDGGLNATPSNGTKPKKCKRSRKRFSRNHGSLRRRL